MMFIKHPLCLKRTNRVSALAELREERIVSRMFWPVWTPVLLSFAIVDGVATKLTYIPFFLFFRFGVALLTYVLYYLARGRVRHNKRAAIVPTTFALGVQAIMIYFGLEFSPYFAGGTILLFAAATYFPRKAVWGLWLNTLTLLPTILTLAYRLHENFYASLVGLAMTGGMIMTAALFSGRVRKFWFESLTLEMVLRQSLLSRESEIRSKAEELLKRRQFERQFSPQVVAEVLNDIQRYQKLSPQRICVLVCDIKGSSSKSKTLHPEIYSEVVEEVFDIISAGCLKWDLTIDKFTGDGAQAFSGSPRSRADDFKRAVKAAEEVLNIIGARRDYLETRWQGPLELRFGVCEGISLVGFLGGGAMKSFTAIGQAVSLAHRICAEAKENTILIHSLEQDIESSEIFSLNEYSIQRRVLKGLRGFEDHEVLSLELKPRLGTRYPIVSFGRCPECSTPLVLEENASGLPKAACPMCSKTSLVSDASKEFRAS